MGIYKYSIVDHIPVIDSDSNSMLASQSLNMYEVTTAKTLKEESPETEANQEKQKPKVLCASYNNWFVIAVSSDIHVFDISIGCTEFNPDSSRGRLEQNRGGGNKRLLSIPEDQNVVALQFLPSSDVVLIVLDSGSVLFFNPANRLSHEKKAIIPPLEECSLDAVVVNDYYSICISDSKGTLHFIAAPRLEIGITDDDEFQTHCSSTSKVHSVHKLKARFVAHVVNEFILFPSQKGQLVCSVSVHQENFHQISPLFPLGSDVQMVRTIGCHIVVLLSSGELIFFDQTLIQIHSMNLFKVKDEEQAPKRILDFQFLDVPENHLFSKDTKLLLKTQTEQGVQFTIKQLNQVVAQFSIDCSEHSVLVPFSTPGDENSIIFVDAFATYSPKNIFVRFVGEAQPSIRLKKLLNLKRFDEALEFAKTHSLPLDTIYTALVVHHQEQMQTAEGGTYEVQTFQNMMHSLARITDGNAAGDYCVAALKFVNQYEHIKDVLDFAKGLKITDEYTLEEIATFRYELASYRMVFGMDGSADFRPNSVWPAFFTSETHGKFFDRFCEQGKIAEARILFARYGEIAIKLQERGALARLLALFTSSIRADPNLCEPISEFMEGDLMPIFLYSDVNDVKGICSKLCAFFIDVSMMLEGIEPKKFPQNSLSFAETFQRAIESLKTDCRTSDQHIGFLHILKQLDEAGHNTGSSIHRLNVLIGNLRSLAKIHSKYLCMMSYSEFLTHDTNSICFRIMDRVRSAQSIREHIDQFVFPYIEEHNLDKNDMLHAYIKQLATAYSTGTIAQHSNIWDLLSLKITEQITDVNMRCKAIIEIAAGTSLPWSQQLAAVIKGVYAHGDKIDPDLIKRLRRECIYAELGQVFINYQIPLSARSKVIGEGGGLRPLLQFMFKNGNREMHAKLQDAFKVIEICETLESRSLFTTVDCYFCYATVLVLQFSDESSIEPLVELFQHIKSAEEIEAVAWKIVSYFRCQLSPTKIKKLIEQRKIWLSCLLCVLERYIPCGPKAQALIRGTRNIRKLQLEHQIVIGFETLRQKDTCIAMLTKFVEAPNEKSIVEVVNFGRLLGLEVRDVCEAIIRFQIKNKLPDTALETLAFLVKNTQKPTKLDITVALDTCTYVCWKLTESAKDEERNHNRVEFSRHLMRLFGKILPQLIDWTVQLETIPCAESFFKILRYYSLFNNILELCPQEEAMATISESNSAQEVLDETVKSVSDKPKRSTKLYTTTPRLGILLPHQEGTMYDPNAVVKAISVVASSVVESSPVESEHIEAFNEDMCDYWDRLFMLLSSSNIMLEIQARQLARTLSCFNATENGIRRAQMGTSRNVVELCKKIFSTPVADLQLAAHLLGSLPVEEMKKALQDLRRWVMGRKNVRFTLNLIHVSLFVLILTSQDPGMIRTVVAWLETTQWQKRLFKRGLNIANAQLKRDNICDLIGEFAKALLSPSFLKEYCAEANCAPNDVLLSYAIELCKLSSGITDSKRFALCLQTATSALNDVNADARTAELVMFALKDICPYNYEAIGLLVNKLQKCIQDGVGGAELGGSVVGRMKDAITLMKFLRCTKRSKSIIANEIRWYKQFTGQRGYDTSMLTGGENSIMPDETSAGTATVSSSMHIQPQQGTQSFTSESELPNKAANRLPFHLLFSEDREESEKIQVKIVYHELTIFNVKHWITLVEETKQTMQHSRTHILVAAISNQLTEMVKYKRGLDSEELRQIKMLIDEANSRQSVIKGIATRFQRLQLSQNKVFLMQLLCEVVEGWLAKSAQLKMGVEEQSDLATSREAFRKSARVIKTEFLLEQCRLLNADTATLTINPAELINHLLCNSKIDWTSPQCISEYFRVINEIARIHDIDAETTFVDLIDRWVPGGAGDGDSAGLVASDPDSTIDFTGSSSAVAQIHPSEDSEFVVPVLYDDIQITRIIVLLGKIRNPLEKIRELSQKFENDASILPGGYMTKIRIACCILRYLSGDQMKALFGINLNQFCGNLVDVLNQRLYSLCRIEIPLKELQIAEKRMDFVRSIVSPQSIYRHTPEIAHLLVCLIVDNDIADLGIIGKALQRLTQLRLAKPLFELLKYLRSIRGKDIKSIPNLATYFGKTFEALFDKLDTNSKKELSSLVHFLIGCPVEGEGQFARSNSLLNTAHGNGNSFSALIQIAADATSNVTSSIK